MTERDRIHWDERHAAASPSPDPATRPIGPPAHFGLFVEQFPERGHALDLACGSGRISVWLARRGLHVWGIDVSPVAIEQATALAGVEGLAERCRFAVVDLDDGLPAGPPADVIVCHRFRDARLDTAIVEQLAPGGLLAIVALSEVGSTPGPFRVKAGELPAAFASLHIIESGEGDGEAWLLARK